MLFRRAAEPDPRHPHVVIIGGGFGGLYAAKALAGKPVRVTLLDRRNHHLFQPLLYQVATAALSPADIASPIRAILRHQRNCEVLLAEARAVDAAARKVVLADGAVPYDYLIVAAGAGHSYFGHDEWEKFAPGLKSLEDALEIRRRMLLAFEAAERCSDPAVRDPLLTFVVVGGGPTGVELAGALAEIARTTLASDFRRIDPRTAKVILLEAGPRILAQFPEHLADKAKGYLTDLGVDVRTGSAVTDLEDGVVRLKDGVITARTVLWAAGVKANALGKSLGAPTDRAGRVLVNPDLTVPGHPDVFVVGDLTSLTDPKTGKPVPGVAPAAIQMGEHAAANVLRAAAGQPMTPFQYWDKGSMAVIGRGRAVAMTDGWSFGGWLAWLAWALVHVLYLIGFRNRFLVMLQWAWQYLTFQSGARLITEERDDGSLTRMRELIARPPAAGEARAPAVASGDGDGRASPAADVPRVPSVPAGG